MSNPISQDRPFYLAFLGGFLGQSAELILGGHVLNRIAIEQQAYPQRGSFSKTVKHIYHQEGIQGFYSGLKWNVLQGSFKGATRWGINDQLFKIFEATVPKRFDWATPLLVGMSGAAFETTVYLCPTESLKTREITHGWRGFAQFRSVMKQEGPAILTKGWSRLYLRQAITWATYLTVYDKFRQITLQYRDGKPVTRTDKCVMNALTGMTACLMNTPLDMLKTQAQMTVPLKERGLLAALQAIFKAHGMSGIYLSLPTRMMRSSFYAVVTFTVMDFLDALPARMRV